MYQFMYLPWCKCIIKFYYSLYKRSLPLDCTANVINWAEYILCSNSFKFPYTSIPFCWGIVFKESMLPEKCEKFFLYANTFIYNGICWLHYDWRNSTDMWFGQKIFPFCKIINFYGIPSIVYFKKIGVKIWFYSLFSNSELYKS